MSFFSFFQSIFCKDHIITIITLNKKVSELRSQIDGTKDPKEEYYNNKYPKSNLTYLRHETDGDYYIDLRDFFMLEDSSIPMVTGESDDQRAINGLKWVISNIKYISDSSDSTYKNEEYWAFPYQTLKHKSGDCEDGSILLANILIKSGIPYWKVRLSAGDVIGGGHCYLTYYDENNDRWVLLDWCYYPNQLEIKDRKDYKDEPKYKSVWFSWNPKYCWTNGTKTIANDYLKQTKRRLTKC